MDNVAAEKWKKKDAILAMRVNKHLYVFLKITFEKIICKKGINKILFR